MACKSWSSGAAVQVEPLLQTVYVARHGVAQLVVPLFDQQWGVRRFELVAARVLFLCVV